MKHPFLYGLRRYKWYLLGRFKIKNQVSRNAGEGKLKIILGAGPTLYDGWISTDIPHFDILKEKNWQYFFGNAKADNILIEHVLEHFTEEQALRVLSLANKYLKPNGCLRIAVPDGYRRDADYVEHVAPPAHGHLSLWNLDSLQKVLADSGFRMQPLEYYSKEGSFTGEDFDTTNGTIIRSRTKGYENETVPGYSSLIVDAYKS